jgi:hypothetical protein
MPDKTCSIGVAYVFRPVGGIGIHYDHFIDNSHQGFQASADVALFVEGNNYC